VDHLLIGLIQGLTEFLPVSSSGHLLLARTYFHLQAHGADLEVFLHGGTLLAMGIYFAPAWLRALRDPGLRLPWVLGVMPAGVAGLLLEDRVDAVFGHPGILPFTFLLNSLVLLSLWRRRASERPLTSHRALLIGLAQVAALLPGISRSGTTITVALHLGLPPDQAFFFSFLIGAPLMAGAWGLKLLHGSLTFSPFTLGAFGVAFVSGLAALWVLRRTTLPRRFRWFGVYSLVLALLTGLWLA